MTDEFFEHYEAWLPFFDWMQRHVRTLYAAAIGGMGLMVGSFLNVAVYRWPRGLNLLRPPSSCPSCGHLIRARDNVPVLGWLLLRGRCRDCGAPISPRYPLVEALNGGLWAAAGWIGWAFDYGPMQNAGAMLAFLVFISLLVTATFIDFDVQLIPDEASLGGAVFMLAAAVAWPALHTGTAPASEWWFPAMGPRFESAARAAAGMAVGAGIIYGITLLGTLAFRRRIEELKKDDPELDSAVGMGDTKLMLLIGAYLGPGWTVSALLWAVYAGGLVGVILKWVTGTWPEGGSKWNPANAWRRWRSGAALMALGPYLAFGGLMMAYGGDRLAAAEWMWSMWMNVLHPPPIVY